MTPDSTLAVTKTCPKDGVHLCLPFVSAMVDIVFPFRKMSAKPDQAHCDGVLFHAVDRPKGTVGFDPMLHCDFLQEYVPGQKDASLLQLSERKRETVSQLQAAIAVSVFLGSRYELTGQRAHLQTVAAQRGLLFIRETKEGVLEEEVWHRDRERKFQERTKQTRLPQINRA